MDYSSDETDEWFIESINAYKDLHVFQLDHPTKVIEWTDEKSVCVAGYSTTKNEILELLLPLKLFAGDNQGLCAERDFKVDHGGFSEDPVECLKHIPGKRLVVTSGSCSSRLHIWDLGGDDSDVIKRIGVINPREKSAKGCKLAPGLTEEPCVLHGSCIKDVQLTELTSGRVLHSIETDSSDTVGGLQFIGPSVFLICATNGSLYVGDTRDSLTKEFPLRNGKDDLQWCFALKTEQSQADSGSTTVARLSSCGRAVVSDFRDLTKPLCRAQLDVKVDAPGDNHMTVTWAPALDCCLAVSGFDGTVQIYDTTSWNTELQDSQPTFVHRGHTMSYEAKTNVSSTVVTTHAWHPWRPRTVLSAATDGSVHVWDWVTDSS